MLQRYVWLALLFATFFQQSIAVAVEQVVKINTQVIPGSMGPGTGVVANQRTFPNLTGPLTPDQIKNVTFSVYTTEEIDKKLGGQEGKSVGQWQPGEKVPRKNVPNLPDP